MLQERGYPLAELTPILMWLWVAMNPSGMLCLELSLNIFL